MSHEIMNGMFPLKESLTYYSRFPFKSQNVHSVAYGTETLNFIGPKIWSLLPSEIKATKPDKCLYKSCKKYVVGLGLINLMWNIVFVYEESFSNFVTYRSFNFNFNFGLFVNYLYGFFIVVGVN